MIADQEMKFISDGNKKRALAIPEAPWKWFTCYELGFPMLTDEHERPMHTLVEVFVDDQLEAYWSETEEDIVPLPPLIGRLQTIKEGWSDQGCAELPTLVDRAITRERFSTSHIARNPMKLPEIVLEDEDFLSMIQNPPEVGAVRIHMDPGNLDTSYGGITTSTFQGVATMITSAGPLEMEGVRWHLLSKVFSSPGDIRTDLNRERLLQETMDKDINCRSLAWQVQVFARPS